MNDNDQNMLLILPTYVQFAQQDTRDDDEKSGGVIVDIPRELVVLRQPSLSSDDDSHHNLRANSNYQIMYETWIFLILQLFPSPVKIKILWWTNTNSLLRRPPSFDHRKRLIVFYFLICNW